MQAARAMPMADHAPVGFEARVRMQIASRRPKASAADIARSWLDGLFRAACLAGAIAFAGVVLHALVPVAQHPSPDLAHEPDLLGQALLADVPGLLDDGGTEEGNP